jgi:serine/threonine-protein kinase
MGSQATSVSPRTIGRYVLYGEIAVGGMATVHFGRLIGQAGFARSVAIKRLHAHYARDPEFVAMFLDEARLAARIVHPNVVPTLDVVVVDEELFLVMEYVRGASLSRLIRNARVAGEYVPPRIASSILTGALHGLHAAHEAKNEQGERLDIVHRDVSPQNVMVGTDGGARVLDFGVAKAIGRSQTTRDGQLKGKLAYMAPEQIRGEHVSRRTDVYAASVVLWETLAGARLYRSENEGHLIAKVMEGKPPPPSSHVPGLPPGLDAIVLRGLDLDPARRFATARDMASELAACVPVAPAEEVGEWVERHAAEELNERAARIADIERDSSVSQSRSLPRAGAPADAPTPVGEREADPPTLAATRVKPAEVPSQVSSVSLAHPTDSSGLAPGRARKSAPWVALATAVALGIVAVLVVLRTVSRASAGDVTSTVPTSPAPSAEVVPPHSASTPEAPSAASSAPAVAVASLPLAPPAASSSAPGPQKPPHATTGSHANVRPNCTPPYTTDEHGHVHFKPACL